MAEHILKCWPNSYDAVASGTKRFEWRKDDRGFEVGDTLLLRKWDPEKARERAGHVDAGYMYRHYTQAHDAYVEQRVRVTYILRGMFGIPDGYCIMSIDLFHPPDSQ